MNFYKNLSRIYFVNFCKDFPGIPSNICSNEFIHGDLSMSMCMGGIHIGLVQGKPEATMFFHGDLEVFQQFL